MLIYMYRGLSCGMCRGHRRILSRRWCGSWQRQTNCSTFSRALEDRRSQNFVDFCFQRSTLWRQTRSSWCWSWTHSSLARGVFSLLPSLSFSLLLFLPCLNSNCCLITSLQQHWQCYQAEVDVFGFQYHDQSQSSITEPSKVSINDIQPHKHINWFTHLKFHNERSIRWWNIDAYLYTTEWNQSCQWLK